MGEVILIQSFRHRIRRHYAAFLLLVIFIVGMWFRFWWISGSVWQLSGYDESRDMLVARHIVEYGDWIWRGPLSSGSMNQLMNSPVYYYLVSLMWFVGRSPLSVMIFWSTLSLGLIYAAYRIGVMIWDKQLGIILALLFAVQPTLVSNSRHISQPYLLPLFSSLFLWLFWTKSTMLLGKLCLFIIVLIVPMHVHYGSLLLLPAGFLWIGIEWFWGIKKNPNPYWWFVPFLLMEYLLILWVWLTFANVPFDQQFFLMGEVQRNWGGLFAQAEIAGAVMLENLWWGKDVRVVLGMLAFFVGVTAWYFNRSNQIVDRKKKYWWMLVFAITPPVVAGFHGDIIHTSYLLGTLPMLIIVVAIGLRVVLAHNRYIGFVCIGIVVWIFAEQALTVVYQVPIRSYYKQMQEISKTIYEDYLHEDSTSDNQPKLALAVLAGKYLPYDGWGTGALWYVLEERFGQRLVRLRDSAENFSPMVSDATHFYVLCDYRGLAREPENLCVQRFRSIRDYLLVGEEEVFRSGEFAVWRFRIDPSQRIGGYNAVYPDFWQPPEQ